MLKNLNIMYWYITFVGLTVELYLCLFNFPFINIRIQYWVDIGS